MKNILINNMVLNSVGCMPLDGLLLFLKNAICFLLNAFSAPPGD